MSKILAIDYGKKRTGLAISDELQMIASPLVTVPTDLLLNYLKNLLSDEKIETIVIGLPKKLNNELGDLENDIQLFIQQLQIEVPNTIIERVDERFTSKMASQSILMSGIKKTKRQNKSLVDNISATIILQSYLYR